MKKYFLAPVFLILIMLSSGCSWRQWLGLARPEETPSETASQITTFFVRPASSTLAWSAKNVRGFNGNGEMKIASGSFVADQSGVTGGSFVFDTASFVKNGGNTLAADQLRLDTYLNAAKLFTVSFEITDIHSVDVRAVAPTEYEVTGNLKAALWSRTVTFPMTFVRQGNSLVGDGVISSNPSQQAARTVLPAEATDFLKKTKGSVEMKLHIVANAE